MNDYTTLFYGTLHSVVNKSNPLFLTVDELFELYKLSGWWFDLWLLMDSKLLLNAATAMHDIC